ncbi:Gfo/Idh/MocA family oxidoreductase [Ruminococcaceae bacterium OttesenSCG-928-L11]|nr:Gfo/Idh/MocA family oxidoreductase [Ruminococcaceae bacterium OttesenSCG-928-L11]
MSETAVKKVGVIGCGRIAVVYREAFRALEADGILRVCYAVDKDLERAREFASHFEGCGASDKVEDLLEQGLDTVHILTPHFLHARQAIACLEAGLDVLCEKPIAINLQDADAMANAAKQAGKQLGIIYQNRYISGIQHARQLVRDGKLGKPLAAWSSLNWHRPPSYYECDWKGSWEQEGGGVIIDQAIHSMDLVRYLLDSEAVEVKGQIDRRVLKTIEVEDVATAAIAFANGVVYAFSACNYNKGNSPIQIEWTFENGIVHLTGDAVEIAINGAAPYVVEAETGPDHGGENYWGYHHEVQIRDFYRCLNEGVPVPFAPEDAKKTLQLVQGVYESSFTGKTCRIPEDLPPVGRKYL